MKAAPLLLVALALPVQAAWQWDEPITVNTAVGAAIFPHLESANRKGVAVSAGTVGVVWEDNRDGTPQCYLAIKPAQAAAFRPEIRLSRGECYEPVLQALDGGRFVAAWEEDGRVRAQIWPGGTLHDLSMRPAAQATLASRGAALYAAWVEQAGRFRHVVVARIEVQGDALRVSPAQPVEAGVPVDEQGWPALAISGDGDITVAWEDRRHRHTVPLTSHSRDHGKSFSAPARLADTRSGSVDGLGAGTGAMRPTLAARGTRGVAAVWLDKRDFLSGYDVYAAFDAGERRFGRNLKVQDSFGDNMAQWHATVVADGEGRLVVLWDDARDGTPDVWLSEWDGADFSEDFGFPGGAGTGAQSDPVAGFDADGALHVVWLDRDDAAGTRVRYSRAVRR